MEGKSINYKHMVIEFKQIHRLSQKAAKKGQKRVEPISHSYLRVNGLTGASFS